MLVYVIYINYELEKKKKSDGYEVFFLFLKKSFYANLNKTKQLQTVALNLSDKHECCNLIINIKQQNLSIKLFLINYLQFYILRGNMTSP